LLLRMKWFVVLLATTVLLLSLSLTAVATPDPVIAAITPAQGFDNQQISITIEGAKFYSPKTTIKLVRSGQQDIVATDVVVSKNCLTGNLNLNGQAPGTWDVIVTNFGKILKTVKPTVLTGAFTIVSSAPKITAIAPTNAFNNAEIALIVSGINFRPGATVFLVKDSQIITFNTNKISKDGDQIKSGFSLKGATPGLYDIQVKNTDGSTAVLKQAFTVTAAPVVVPTPPAITTPPVTTPAITTPPVTSAPKAPVDPNSLFKSIFFDFDQATVRPDQVEALKANLALVKEAKNGYIILGGHADERGPSNYNIKLSAKRAETIKRFLTLSGIGAQRIVIYAYGETSPKSLGHNEESWQFNRRVDITIWAEVPNQKDALKK
jgi:peptidoglycan-associated lipoprotein